MIPIIISLCLINQVYEVEDLVVTATRYPAMLKDISAGTIVIDRQTIEAKSPSSIGELLQNLAGIDVRDYGNAGSVSSVSIRGTPSSGVVVLLDGIPLNSVQTGIADLSNIDVHDVEQVEIIKGPVSSLYGANGIGGIINIITRKERISPKADARIRKTAARVLKPCSSTEYSVKYAIPIKTVYYLTKVRQLLSNSGRTNTDMSEFNLKNQIGFRLKQIEIDFQNLFTGKNYGLPGPAPLIDSFHIAPPCGDSTATSIYDNQTDRFWFNNLSAKYRPFSNLRLNTHFFGNFQNSMYHTKYQFWTTTIEDYNYSSTTLGNNTAIIYELGTDKLVAGFDFRYDTLNAEKKSLQTGDTSWSACARNAGYWTAITKRISNNIKLNPCLRYDHNSAYGNFISPSLGIITEINQRFWLKFSIAQAFRAPGFNDLYWPIYGNKDLKPEHGNAYELRIETAPKYNLFTAFSLFRREINDRIAWLPTKDGLWKPENVNYVVINGIETEMRTKIAKNFGIILDATYLFARQKNRELVYYDFINNTMEFCEIERDAAFIPDLTASVKCDYAVVHDFFLNICLNYTSARTNYYENWSALPVIAMDTKRIDPCFLVELNVRKKFLDHFSLKFGVKNLFDRKYAVQFGNSIQDKDYPMPGRTICGEISWQ